MELSRAAGLKLHPVIRLRKSPFREFTPHFSSFTPYFYLLLGKKITHSRSPFCLRPSTEPIVTGCPGGTVITYFYVYPRDFPYRRPRTRNHPYG